MSGGIAAEHLVERRLRRPVHLESAGGVVGDTALTGRHHRDRSSRINQILQLLHGAHDAEDVGVHHPFKIMGVDVRSDRVLVSEGDARDDEQQIERPAGQPVPEAGDFFWLRDVDLLDRDHVAVSANEVAQR